MLYSQNISVLEMKRVFFAIIGIILFSAALFADEVSFVISAPKSVVVGRNFQVQYTVNSTKVGEPIVPFADFKLLAGPYQRTYSRMMSSEVNGVYTTHSENGITYTYTLLAEKEGTFTLPAATIEVEGKKISSNTAKIKVLPQDKTNQSANSRSRRDNREQWSSSVNISNEELFVRAIISKTTVYEQEAVLLTFKAYTLVNLTNLSIPNIDIKDCVLQSVDLPQSREGDIEHYNGTNYRVYTWQQFVLFPQKSGEIAIPSIEYEATVGVGGDVFDIMFNGRPSSVKKVLRTAPIKLNVKELPAGKPIGFSGGVGNFRLKSSLSTNELKANEAVTLRLVISGVGNMKLIKTPEIEFPESFEVYDPKIENRFKLTNSGFSGDKVIEYLAIPRQPGEFTIPALKFSYFDTQSGEYKTIETESYTLNVAKGKEGSNEVVASFVSKEELKMLGQDVRYIKTGAAKLQKAGEYFFASTTYLLCYIVPLLLFAIYIMLYYKQMRDNADISGLRIKKANSIAVKRLKVSQKLLKENNKELFYDEILKALWGYVSDKLNIPVSRLTKDNVAAELSAKGVSADIISELESVLNECEFARYAPGDAAAAMDNVYKKAMEIIGKMENTIKR